MALTSYPLKFHFIDLYSCVRGSRSMVFIFIMCCLRRNPKQVSFWECAPKESSFLKFTTVPAHLYYASHGERQRKYPLV